MSPKQQDLHLSKTFMKRNYLITVNWLSGMREYYGYRRACIVLHTLNSSQHHWVQYTTCSGKSTIYMKSFLIEFAVFICGLKTIADSSCRVHAKLEKLTCFLSYSWDLEKATESTFLLYFLHKYLHAKNCTMQPWSNPETGNFLHPESQAQSTGLTLMQFTKMDSMNPSQRLKNLWK